MTAASAGIAALRACARAATGRPECARVPQALSGTRRQWPRHARGWRRWRPRKRRSFHKQAFSGFSTPKCELIMLYCAAVDLVAGNAAVAALGADHRRVISGPTCTSRWPVRRAANGAHYATAATCMCVLACCEAPACALRGRRQKDGVRSPHTGAQHTPRRGSARSPRPFSPSERPRIRMRMLWQRWVVGASRG